MFIHTYLDGLTMYRVVLYALSAIAFAALVLSIAGVLAVTPLALLLSCAVLVVSAVVTHVVLVRLTGAPGNIESTYITALILVLILTPVLTVGGLVMLALIGASSIALKYIVRYRLRHIFNPVALVLVLFGLTGYYGAEWWVGSRYLLPVVALAALAVVVKTRRWPLVFTYVGVSTIVTTIVFLELTPWHETMLRHFISWPTIFFAAFMLTEPLGLPSTKRLQYGYAAIAAVLSSIPFSIGPLYGTPELALLAANLFTVVADRPVRYALSFIKKETVGAGTVEYTFAADGPVRFVPGQYLEWTLPHEKPDVRGIRRYFTISSVPNQDTVSFAVRHGAVQSSFKTALASLAPGHTLYATQKAGDFIVREGALHHVLIAGGIGVTPFVSMIRATQAEGKTLSATLFYCNKTAADIAFLDLCREAEAVGVRVVHVLQDGTGSDVPFETGFITPEMIAKYVTNWRDATYYISGPPGLVDAYKKLLRRQRVSRRRVVTDYFPGLA